MLVALGDVNMSDGIVVSPSRAVTKTRNAILRIKKCSPELRTVLRQRCQERIHNDRLNVLSKCRNFKIRDSFKIALGNILREEWKNIENEESDQEMLIDSSPDIPLDEFNIDDELLLEELLEKELILEHEDWLLQQYEELFREEIEKSDDVACPFCFSGFLKLKNCQNVKRTYCTKCPATFVIEKSLLDLQGAIYECLAWHDKQCDYMPGFSNVFKNEKESNLCVICSHCSYLNIIV